MADCTRGHCAAWHSRGAATARMRRDNSPQHLLGWLSNASSPEASAPIALNCFGMVAEPTHTPTLSRSATQPAKCQGSSSANRHSAGRVDQPKWLRKGPPVPPSRLHPALVLDHRITRARSRCARADRSQGAIGLGLSVRALAELPEVLAALIADCPGGRTGAPPDPAARGSPTWCLHGPSHPPPLSSPAYIIHGTRTDARPA
jgi:hypothetical protein